jgi:hypothetical protein
MSAGLVAVLGTLLHNDPPVGALTDANHHAAMVLLEGNALESPRRLTGWRGGVCRLTVADYLLTIRKIPQPISSTPTTAKATPLCVPISPHPTLPQVGEGRVGGRR